MLSTFYSTYRHEHEPQHLDLRLDKILGQQFTPNANTANKHHQKCIRIDRALCFVVGLQMVLINLYFQLDLVGKNNSGLWLVFSTILGLISVAILVLRYAVRNQYLGKMQEGQESQGLLIFNIGTLLLMPYPFLEHTILIFYTGDQQCIEFKLNYLLTTLSYLRFIPLAVAILTKSKYLTPRAYRLGKMNSVQPDLLYALRAFYQHKPLSFINIVFLISVTLISIALRVAQCKSMSTDIFVAYSNVVWMTAMTMTTVGFGDMLPVSPLGRIVAAVCAVWGVLILAVMVGVLSKILALNSKQTQSVLILKKLQSQSTLKQKASLYIRTSLWRLWKNHKYKLSKPQTLDELNLRRQFYSLRNKRQHQSKQDLTLNLVTEMDREFNRVLFELEYLLKNNSKIIDHLNEEVIFKKGNKLKTKKTTSLADVNYVTKF